MRMSRDESQLHGMSVNKQGQIHSQKPPKECCGWQPENPSIIDPLPFGTGLGEMRNRIQRPGEPSHGVVGR